jgi:hypothetical protein
MTKPQLQLQQLQQLLLQRRLKQQHVPVWGESGVQV